MAHAELATSASDRLLELVGRLERHEGFDPVVAGLLAGQAATLDGVWGSSRALVAASLARHAPGPLVIVCPHADDVDRLIDDLSLFSRVVPERFAARESLATDRLLLDEVFGDRVRVCEAVGQKGPDLFLGPWRFAARRRQATCEK